MKPQASSQASWKADARIELEQGVLLVTYSLLASAGRLQQLLDWCGDGFDGVVALDEVHRASGTALAIRNKRNARPTKSAEAIDRLQQELPAARVLYCSATSATNVASMGNLSRLHLWGANLPFESAWDFASALGRGGVGASEILAMELKSRGLLVARSLSFDGTSFETVACPLSNEQRRTYDAACALWADLLESARRREAQEDIKIGTIYWGEHLRFFQQLLVSSKVDAAAERVRAALDAGEAVVIGMQSTGAAATEAAADRLASSGSRATYDAAPGSAAVLGDGQGQGQGQGPGPEQGQGQGTASAALEIALRAIEKTADPADQSRLCTRATELGLPAAALPTLIDALGGGSAVAEISGRTKREREASGGEGVTNAEELAAFEEGRKRVALLSAAGSTGVSLHNDPRHANRARRAHLTLELPWAAAAATQQLGRTHRASQLQPPRYELLTSDGPGEARKASQVAARLAGLGALRGDRRAGSVADLSNFDMHNHPLAREALVSVLGQLGVSNPAELEPRERAIRYASRVGKRATVARGLLRCLLRGR